jgi:hypothetical protein
MATQAQGFNTMGATPNLSSAYGSPPPNLGSAVGASPYAKALSGATNSYSPVSPVGTYSIPSASQGGPLPTPTGTTSSLPPQPGLILNSTPLKSTTHTNVDGSSSTQTFHAPATGTSGSTTPPPPAVSSTYNGINSSTGQSNAQGQNTNSTNTTPTTYTDANGNTIDANGNIIALSANGSNTFPGIINQTVNSARGNAPIGQNAQNIANTAGAAITQVGQQGADAQAGYLTTGTTPVAEGNAAVIANNTANQEQAIASGANMKLAGNAQALTAENQQTAGLQGAANSIAPTGSFPFTFNPATGTFTSMGGNTSSTSSSGSAPTLTYNPSTDATTLAKAVISGQIPYSDAVQAMGYAGGVGTGLLTGAITAQGGNLTKILAEQAVTQGNIQTAGTASTNAAAANLNTSKTAVTNANSSGLQTAIPSYNNIKTSVQNVGALGNMTVSLGSQGNINPFAAVPANTTIQSFLEQLSSPDQVKFNSAMASFQSAAGALLAQADGSLPTTVSSQIGQIANGSLSMGALQALVNQAQAEGAVKQGDQASQVINYQSQLNGKAAPNLPGTLTENGNTYVLNSDGSYDQI